MLRVLSTRFGHALARRTIATSATPLKKTGLYDFHLANNAKMVPFAGYSMPLSYGDVGQVVSHNHVRTHAGLFDVAHMVQTNFTGPSAQSFLSHLTPSSLSSLPPFSSTLSVLLNHLGGIIDDTIVTKHTEDKFYVVTNAGRRERDLAWFAEQLSAWNEGQGKGKEVSMEVLEGWGLVALQGPAAAKHLQSLTPFDLSKLTFGKSAFMSIGGVEVHVARGGYTGEDGFEISLPPSETVSLTNLLTSSPSVQLIGLGARDSLRLEAGMCLYGHDLNESIGPVEGGLGWVVGKDRKEAGDFIGAEGVLKQFKEGPLRRRVGFLVEGAPAREGANIFGNGEQIGTVTSGIPSPTLGKNIAMGYVSTTGGWHKKNTEVEIEVRNRMRKAVVTPMPFVPTKYYRG